MDIYVPENERQNYEDFCKIYEPYVWFRMTGNGTEVLRPTFDRICRFCKKKIPDTTFDIKAHIIPYLLGNKNQLWDEECDSCNSYFSVFETHLSNYLGVLRTLHKIQGGSKTPTFSSIDANVEFRNVGNGRTMFYRKDRSKGFTFDPIQSKLEIDTSRRPYIPAYVYAAFLKIALSVLPEQDVAGYKVAYKYILDKENFHRLQGPLRLEIAVCNYEYDVPIITLFKIKKGVFSHPQHLLAVYVKSFMFQIAFPLHLCEIVSNGWDITVPRIPYVDFTCMMSEPITIDRYEDDLHGTEQIHDKNFTLVI